MLLMVWVDHFFLFQIEISVNIGIVVNIQINIFFVSVD